MKTLKIITLIGLVTLSLITILVAFVGHWSLDLLSHFKLQFLVLVSLTLVVLSFIKEGKTALYFSPLFLYLLIEVGGLYVGGQKNTALENTMKITSINALSSNRDHQKIIEFVATEQPDVLAIQEMNIDLERSLNQVLLEYKYRLVISRQDNFGIGLYSKIPLDTVKQIVLNDKDLPAIQADFQLENKPVTLLVVHPVPPINQDYFTTRNNEYAEITTFSKAIDHELIVIGDFNSTSFSRYYKKLIKESNLVDSRKGFGIQSTWSALNFINITLDHCLISKGLGVKYRRVGENIGSDHLPITVEIGRLN